MSVASPVRLATKNRRMFQIDMSSITQPHTTQNDVERLQKAFEHLNGRFFGLPHWIVQIRQRHGAVIYKDTGERVYEVLVNPDSLVSPAAIVADLAFDGLRYFQIEYGDPPAHSHKGFYANEEFEEFMQDTGLGQNNMLGGYHVIVPSKLNDELLKLSGLLDLKSTAFPRRKYRQEWVLMTCPQSKCKKKEYIRAKEQRHAVLTGRMRLSCPDHAGVDMTVRSHSADAKTH
jgi:hypothetical protein